MSNVYDSQRDFEDTSCEKKCKIFLIRNKLRLKIQCQNKVIPQQELKVTPSRETQRLIHNKTHSQALLGEYRYVLWNKETQSACFLTTRHNARRSKRHKRRVHRRALLFTVSLSKKISIRVVMEHKYRTVHFILEVLVRSLVCGFHRRERNFDLINKDK